MHDTHANGGDGARQDGWMTQRAHGAASWYTPDWVTRYRKCSVCHWRGLTIELLVEDLKTGWVPRH